MEQPGQKKVEDNRQKTLAYPDQLRGHVQQLVSTIKMISEIPKSIATLRRTLRGEALYQADDGSSQWIQVVKPAFVKLDPLTRQPLRQTKLLPTGETKDLYIPNDEAIEEILSQLFFMGMNQIFPLTNLDENTVIDDLREFECKLSALLCLKQVDWGMDKSLMPMTMSKIKTIVQDARYLCVEGTTMKALTQQVSRIEQVLEGGIDRARKTPSPY